MRRVPLALLGVSALAALGVLAPAWQTDVSGAWELVVETPHGEMTSTVKFIQEREILKVSMTGPRGRETTGEGSIRGDEIEWSIVRDTGSDKLTVVYKGTVQGGTMSGQADISDGRSAPWKAVKH